jgi:hypothetical protein
VTPARPGSCPDSTFVTHYDFPGTLLVLTILPPAAL